MKETVGDPARRMRRPDASTRLVDAACKCISSNGYAATTGAAVRKAAGVSTGSAFHAFRRGKLEIEAAAYKRWADDLRAALDQKDPGRPRPLDKFLSKHLMLAYCQWFMANRHRAAFMFEFEVLAGRSEVKLVVNQVRHELQQTLLHVLNRAERTWHISPSYSPIVESVVLGPLRLSLARWALSGAGAPNPDHDISLLAAAGAAGLKALC